MSLPRPKSNETEHDFVARCMSDSYMLSVYPEPLERSTVAYSLYKNRPLQNTSDDWAETFDIKLIVPGLCNYDEVMLNGEPLGNVYITKEVLDRIVPTLKYKPILNWGHKEVDPEVYKKGRADGIITGTYYGEDGWYHGTGIVWDSETRKNCRSGKFQASICYIPTKLSGQPGIQANIEYSNEVLDGIGEHVAILTNPRYRGATILPNGGGKMKVTLWDKIKKKVMQDGKEVEVEALENSSEIEADEVKITDKNGKAVPLGEAIKVYNSSLAPQKFRVVNGAVTDLTPETIIKYGDKEVTVAKLMNAMDEDEKKKEEEKLKNEADEKKKKEEEEKLKNEAKEKEEKDKKDKLENEAKQKLENAHKAGEHKTKLDNCDTCKTEHFKALENSRGKGSEMEMPPAPRSRQEKLELGKKLF